MWMKNLTKQLRAWAMVEDNRSRPIGPIAIREVIDHIKSLEATIAKQAGKLAECREDSRRLDNVEKYGRTHIYAGEEVYSIFASDGMTLREAIDSARAEAKGE